MFEKGKIYKCYNCGEELEFEVKIGRRDMCPSCNAYLHCCFNCEYYEPSAHNQCREHQGEFIRDKSEGNFCLYFTFRDPENSKEQEESDARKKLEEMFGDLKKEKGKPVFSPRTANDAKARLEALFPKKKKG